MDKIILFCVNMLLLIFTGALWSIAFTGKRHLELLI